MRTSRIYRSLSVARTILAGGGVVGSIGSWDRGRARRRVLDRSRSLGKRLRDRGPARVPRHRPPQAVVSVRRRADVEPFVGIRTGRHGCPGYETSSRPPGNGICGAEPIGVNLAVPLWGVGKTRSLRRTPRLRKRIGLTNRAGRDTAEA
jgi:hypothetical protein